MSASESTAGCLPWAGNAGLRWLKPVWCRLSSRVRTEGCTHSSLGKPGLRPEPASITRKGHNSSQHSRPSIILTETHPQPSFPWPLTPRGALWLASGPSKAKILGLLSLIVPCKYH